jgi:hypothetical protein
VRDAPLARIAVPARRPSLDVLRTATGEALADARCGERCARDVVLATDELAAVLLDVARPESELEVELRADDDDVYVRMSVPLRADDLAPRTPELTGLLLEATADSYDIRIDEGEVVAVIQRGLSDDGG